MKKIVRLIERHSYGCFTVEDIEGNHFIVQLAYKLEEAWTSNETKRKALK